MLTYISFIVRVNSDRKSHSLLFVRTDDFASDFIATVS